MREITGVEIALLLKKQKGMYGNKFKTQWPDSTDAEIFEAWSWGLQGINEQEFACGLNALIRQTWPPTVPEFRRMCQPIDPLDQQWPTAEEAWATGIQNSDENLTFATCDEIQQAWDVASRVWPDKYAARKAFCDVYDKLAVVAKAQMRTPKFWMTLGHESAEYRASAIEQAVDTGVVSVGYKSDAVAMIESTQPVNADVLAKIAEMKAMLGMAPESLAEAEAKREAEHKAKINNQVAVLARVEAERHHWPDPFDDWDAYQDAMFKAKRQIPQAIYNCHNQAKEGAAWTQ